MDKIGDTRRGWEIGKTSPKVNFIYLPCPDCGKERWVQLGRAKIQHSYVLCRSCSNRLKMESRKFDKSPCWKGGRITDYLGYILIKLRPNDFFYSMTHNGYIKEHRLVMAKHLGRCLHSWEIIHHKNHIRSDNRLENLQLIGDDGHKQMTIMENKIKRLEAKIVKLQQANNH